MCGLVCKIFFIPLPSPPPPPHVLFLDFPSPPPPPPLYIMVNRKSSMSGFFVQFFPLISCLLVCPLLIFSGTWLNHHFWVILYTLISMTSMSFFSVLFTSPCHHSSHFVKNVVFQFSRNVIYNPTTCFFHQYLWRISHSLLCFVAILTWST